MSWVNVTAHAVDRAGVQAVLHGKLYLTPKLRAEDWVAAKARARQFSKEMTPRQRDIVQLYAEGRSMKEIADLLDLERENCGVPQTPHPTIVATSTWSYLP